MHELSKKKRVGSIYDMRSKNTISRVFNKYAQMGGALEQDIENKKKEIRDLEAQLSLEKNAEKKEKIQRSLADAKAKVAEIQARMKEMLKSVATKAGQIASKLSSGISSFTGKLSSGISSLAGKLSSGVAKMYEQHKNERAVRDYYAMKAKIVDQITRLKSMKLKKDETCKHLSEKVCEDVVIKKYPSPGELFKNEEIGGVPKLSYY